MAAKTATKINSAFVCEKTERLLMNQLRDKGLEYVSKSGKKIAAKKQPVVFCHCPQKCKEKLPHEKWKSLFEQFYELADQNTQNTFLQSHIVIKAVHLHNWESEKSSPANKRRVTCKYQVPHLQGDRKLADFVEKRGDDSIEVCQKAFMNCYGITEKRVRMQRERCISKLAPGHYKNSPFGKKHKEKNPKPVGVTGKSKGFEFSNGLEITPLDLSSNKGRDVNGKTEVVANNSSSSSSSSCEDSLSDDEKEQPLDLSNPKKIDCPTSPSSHIEIDKTKLYEIAEKIGVPKDRVDKEMAAKYEKLVWQNLRRHQKKMMKKNCKIIQSLLGNHNNTEIENRSPSGKAISDQVMGLGEDFTILPIQTLNNGDLTITPVLGQVSKPVENRDIMRVNTFFQNQLWKPEYIGLSSWRKLRSQSYDV